MSPGSMGREATRRNAAGLPAPPVIVTGMHRSGTTLAVKLLTRLGAFFGARQDPNAEDYFYMRLDEWIMRRAGGAWDYPLPTRRFLSFPRFLEDTVGFLEQRVAAQPAGPPEGGVWGFKDPRIVFTFPAWDRVFPGARLVYIRRNGVDAANSLFVREAARWREGGAAGGGDGKAGAPRDTSYLQIRPLIGRFRDALKSTESYEPYLLSTRCLTLEESFRLWEEYVDEGEHLYAAHPGPKIDVRYEALIADPEPQLLRLARFCGLDPSADAVRAVVAHIDRSRACAFVKDDAARAFYERVRGTPLMQALGYGDLLVAADGA